MLGAPRVLGGEQIFLVLPPKCTLHPTVCATGAPPRQRVGGRVLQAVCGKNPRVHPTGEALLPSSLYTQPSLGPTF